MIRTTDHVLRVMCYKCTAQTSETLRLQEGALRRKEERTTRYYVCTIYDPIIHAVAARVASTQITLKIPRSVASAFAAMLDFQVREPYFTTRLCP
jgi:hypothetical protein